MNAPSADSTVTVSPDFNASSAAAIAPEKIQGWRCRSVFSRPGLSRSTGLASAKRDTGDAAHRKRDGPGKSPEQEHPQAGAQGPASREQREQRADAEERQRRH